MASNQVATWVTERIVKALNEGTIPWRRPWFGGEEAPRNLVSGKCYTGINALLLSCLTFESPYFVTHKQCKARGGKVRKGEKSNMVVFYMQCESKTKTDDKGNPEKFRILRYYLVFNVTQCDGLEYPKPEPNPVKIDPIPNCEALWEAWGDKPVVKTGGRACYSTMSDEITMPDRQRFASAEEWYSTLYHEGIHATGAKHRIGRNLKGSMGAGSYAREELVAEIGAAILCGRMGIAAKTIENSAAYCQSWAKRLTGNAQLIVKASAAAQKAANYIGQPETETETV